MNGGQENDHDLLIRIDEKLRVFMTAVENMKREVALKSDKTEVRDSISEMCKINGDHERRIRRLEKYGAIAIGALYALEFILKFS